MAISRELGEERCVDLKQGRLTYRERGSGPTIVFLHGFWVNGDLWRKVVPLLATRFRCVTPDLPLGGHHQAMRGDADLSPVGVVRLIAEFLEVLELEEATLVANDTAVALAQLLSTDHPERIGRLVLTTGDAFTNFLPWLIKPMRPAAALPGAMWVFAKLMNKRATQAALWHFFARRPAGPDICQSYFGASAVDPAIRRDLRKFLLGATPRLTLRVARRLHLFDRPVLITWTKGRGLVFPYRHGMMLARRFPQGKLTEIADSHPFVPEDQPEVLARHIERFCSQETTHAAQRNDRL